MASDGRFNCYNELADCFLQTGDPSVLYGCITTLVNLTNSYHKEEVIPEMIELAKFAKQHIPETHPMVRTFLFSVVGGIFVDFYLGFPTQDEKKYVDDRVKALSNAGVTTGLVALSKTESRNSKELITRVFNAMCEIPELRGKIVQQGGTKALLALAQDNTPVGKCIAAQALARIGITIDPEVAFPGQRVCIAFLTCSVFGVDWIFAQILLLPFRNIDKLGTIMTSSSTVSCCVVT